MTGYSPFQGETHQETFLNVTMCDYDFDDEMFDVVSQEAKDFIEKLLIKVPRYDKLPCNKSVIGKPPMKVGSATLIFSLSGCLDVLATQSVGKTHVNATQLFYLCLCVCVCVCVCVYMYGRHVGCAASM